MLVGGGVAFAHFASGKVLSKQVRQPKEVLCIQSLLIMWNVGNVREGVNNLGTSVCATAMRAGIHLMAHILFDYNDTYVANIMFRYIDMLYICVCVCICVSECVYMCAHVCAFFPIKLS